MTTTRFLHTADWQLGMRPRFLEEKDAQPRFVQSRIDAIRELAALSAKEACEFAVVAGDVWEHNALDRGIVRRSLEAMGEFACPVYLLPANHDPLDASSIYLSSVFEEHRPEEVHVLASSSPQLVRPDVEVVGVPWSAKHPGRDLVTEALRDLEGGADLVRVCVAHGMVDEAAPDPDDPALLSKHAMEAAIADHRVDYFALGDRHSVTRVAERIWYSGTPEATDYDETDSGKALVVELGEDGCRVSAHPVGRWRFVRETLRLNSTDDVDAARQWLDGLPDKGYTILKLALRGSLGLADKAKLDFHLAEAREVFAGLDIWQRHTDLVLVPDSLDLDELGLGGFAQATVDELEQLASSETQSAATAREALSLLYRLTRRVDE